MNAPEHTKIFSARCTGGMQPFAISSLEEAQFPKGGSRVIAFIGDLPGEGTWTLGISDSLMESHPWRPAAKPAFAEPCARMGRSLEARQVCADDHFQDWPAVSRHDGDGHGFRWAQPVFPDPPLLCRLRFRRFGPVCPSSGGIIRHRTALEHLLGTFKWGDRLCRFAQNFHATGATNLTS
jgi:hypothetical protein